MNENKYIHKKLFNWYNIHKRDLPWRETKDPYKIWISEIILQQTRIAQGLSYYLKFTTHFPDIYSLANASEQEVLKNWEGLGYYSRARNLHYTAKVIIEKYGGFFPMDYQSILGLKGIGEYTASAIVSFAWNLPYPAVDGNVFRFLSRLFAVKEPIDTNKGKKYFTELAHKIMDKEHAGLFNQSIMEFGALQCIPSNPDCLVCPFNSTCLAYADNSVSLYPVKKGKIKTKNIYLNYFHIFDDEHVLIYKRNEGIWKNLFEFPVIESEAALTFDELTQHPSFIALFPENKTFDFTCIIQEKKHILSHRTLYANFYKVYIGEEINKYTSFLKIKTTAINDYPFHNLMQHYISKNLISSLF